jgi:hypothetical protein
LYDFQLDKHSIFEIRLKDKSIFFRFLKQIIGILPTILLLFKNSSSREAKLLYDNIEISSI